MSGLLSLFETIRFILTTENGDYLSTEMEYLGIYPEVMLAEQEVPAPAIDTFIPYPTSGGSGFSKWYQCVECGLWFRESQMVTYKGQRYGIPCGDSRDITQLSSRGK